jgi:hypothetical protein
LRCGSASIDAGFALAKQGLLLVRFFSALRKIATLNCEESAQLLSDSHEAPLGAVDRWALRLHLMVCGYCREFRRQLRVIQQGTRSLVSSPSPEELAAAQARIAARLRGENREP